MNARFTCTLPIDYITQYKHVYTDLHSDLYVYMARSLVSHIMAQNLLIYTHVLQIITYHILGGGIGLGGSLK